MMNDASAGLERRDRPDEIRKMFDTIAPTYDLLNRMLSFGMDVRWRRKAMRLLSGKRGGDFLDLAAGSGDVSFDLLRLSPRSVVGADFSFNMLRVFRTKLQRRAPGPPVSLVSCDAHTLPFRSSSFDGVTIAFGIRNFADRPRALRELKRVMKPGGMLLIIELSTPRAPLAARLYGLYSRIGVPLMGRIVSASPTAYRYLPSSIAAFPEPEEFLSIMREAGFQECGAESLSFGAAHLYTGVT